MIKIQEHLNRDDAATYLDELAIKMWEHLNKKNNDNSYNHHSLIKKLGRLKDKLEQENALNEYAEDDEEKLQRQKDFIAYLEADDCAKLKALVISRPDSLLLLKQEILTYLQQDDLSTNTSGKVKQTTFGNLLISDLFNYKSFRQTQFCYQLLIDANLKNVTCPYCNENAVRVIDISEEESEDKINKAYLDLDHFYPKSQHPYFALSYYNLVPCCHTCNSSEKGDKEFCIETHQQPFYESLNDNYMFQIDSNSFVEGKTDSIELVKKDGYRDDYSVVDLKLNQRYETHLNKVNVFIKHYLNYYNAVPPGGEDWKEAVLQYVPKETHEILSMRLGKMYKDVYEQLKVE